MDTLGESAQGVLGPYLLYVAFAAWHFDFGWFVVLVTLVAGTVLSIIAVVEKVKN